MTNSIMASNIANKLFITISIAVFWLAFWQGLSLLVGDPYFLPSPIDTFFSLLELFSEAYFYKTVLFSLLRVLAGLLLGTLGGIGLAVLCHRFSLLRRLFSPFISVIKAMPVATFIILLWITLRGSSLSIFVGCIMVLPIIYQNLLDGYDSIDPNLIEVTELFEFSSFKRFKLLTFPTLFTYFSPAFITSIGLAFKSQIAAEIIAYTNDSIGMYIFDAKDYAKTDRVFAWAAIIVTFSILLEFVTKSLLRRLKYES